MALLDRPAGGTGPIAVLGPADRPGPVHLHPPRAIAFAGGCHVLAAVAAESAAPARSSFAHAPLITACALAGTLITLAPRRGPWLALALPAVVLAQAAWPALPARVPVAALVLALVALGAALVRAAPGHWHHLPAAALGGILAAAAYSAPDSAVPSGALVPLTVLFLLTPPLAVLVARATGRTGELDRLTRRMAFRVPIAVLAIIACIALTAVLRPLLPASGLLVVGAAAAVHVAVALWSHSRGRRLAEQAARHEAVLEAAILVLSDEAADPADNLRRVAALAATELGVAGVVVELDTVSAGHGQTVERPVDVALVCRGRDLGRLHIHSERALDTRTLTTVDRLARQLAAFAYAVLRLDDARSAEREHLRRELHDGVGHALASAVMRLDPGRHAEHLRPVLAPAHAHVSTALEDLRSIVRGAAPPQLVRDGLADALRALTRDPDGPAVLLTFHGDCQAVSAAVQQDVYRIVQEALTNARRHADAGRVFVSVATTDRMHVEIVDDGRGLPAGPVPGTGLASIRTRIRQLGGDCAIGRAAGGGTRIAFTVPLTPTDAA
ncbi:ATP-binding protein [Yinghuangia soli]|uniref:histidine kinase n=1 Tax=Yinghuangia soli TaxID=2908204 RepID=A0AA41U0V7_9ACTN|nr:ATP-binding protein [Yinghuangia soli]MCF2530188.1 ATP-binding protein [Yinghuangia soli]